MRKPLTVSIVIPVYNEAETIGRCLEAISRQTMRPLEVIVVDNNSTDQTALIVRQYPFATLLHELRQGVVHARNRGFDAARGEVIGRIDADTIVPENWVQTVAALMAHENIGAVTGSTAYYRIAAACFVGSSDMLLRRIVARLLGPATALQGANTAVAARAWRHARGQTCNTSGLHEDFDLGIHIRRAGYRTAYVHALRVQTICRQAAASYGQFITYMLTCPRSYLRHRCWRGIIMYPFTLMVIGAYPLLHLLYKGYDEQTGRFSLRILAARQAASPRPNPAFFAD